MCTHYLQGCQGPDGLLVRGWMGVILSLKSLVPGEKGS